MLNYTLGRQVAKFRLWETLQNQDRVSSTKERWWKKGMVGGQTEGNLTDEKILKENSCMWTVFDPDSNKL